jgi:hypothetical protein
MMKFNILKYNLVYKIRIAFNNILKAINLLQNYDKPHGSETYLSFQDHY